MTPLRSSPSPVIGEFSAVQKARIVQEMDRALAALDVMEEVGAAGEHLCMQSWGVPRLYLTEHRALSAHAAPGPSVVTAGA